MPIDPWLLLCLAGFIVSLLLWFYFFYKYRTSDQSDLSLEQEKLIQGAKSAEPNGSTTAYLPGTGPLPVRPGSTPPSPVLSISELYKKDEKASLPAFVAGLTANVNLPASSSILSPAVAYLQSLKGQLESLHKELDAVKLQMANIEQKNESHYNQIIRRLEELTASRPEFKAHAKPTVPNPEAAPETLPSHNPAVSKQEPPHPGTKDPVWPT